MAGQPKEIHLIWMTTGLGCDGESVAITSATNPTLEEILSGIIPGSPKAHLHNPVLATEVGEDFMKFWREAAEGHLDPFVLIIEGSIPNEEIKEEGFWAAMGSEGAFGQPITTNEWVDKLAPKAAAVVAIGTCAAYGGIPAMKGNPTGAMGVMDYLGWDWKSKEGIPIVSIPGCPSQPDNMTETLLHIILQIGGMSPMIPLDEAHRPAWLFNNTVHENCGRAGFFEEGDFAKDYGSHKCIVKLGCWGPVVKCNVPRRGWINGIGGCPNVGGICIGCTMPSFPDKYMPFMDEPRGASISIAVSSSRGPAIQELRKIAMIGDDKEPSWRHPGRELTTGYEKVRKTKASDSSSLGSEAS